MKSEGKAARNCPRSGTLVQNNVGPMHRATGSNHFSKLKGVDQPTCFMECHRQKRDQDQFESL
jgi:hypothetical protein